MSKTIFKMTSLALSTMCFFAWETTSAQSKNLLLFPKENFVVKSKIVNVYGGEKEVTYRSYMHIPYEANPVDKDYQSLNVYVPVKIDDKNIDATDAPILFDIGVGGYMSVNNAQSDSGGYSERNNRADLALAAGYVVVSPGCRGRDNKTADGTYYGKAPAAIVDLKAAVRYIRYNKGIIPGNIDWIVSVGCSAGGALSALLGTSGNNHLYDNYLKKIGAADAGDNIYASACYSPITDLEHADMAYEWMFGTIPTRSGLVDQELSEQLKEAYADYQLSLNLQGKGDFGTLTAENYQDYLLHYYLIPSADKYLKDLPDNERKEYLEKNSWIVWKDNSASFNFAAFVAHIGRMKGLPAFDDFNKRQPEPVLFGNETTNARHYTNFSLQHSSGNPGVEIDDEMKTVLDMMNAIYFLRQDNSSCASYWWLRNGTSDNHTSQTVMINLATKLENLNKEVNTWLFWDGGHCADYEQEGFIEWIGKITGYTKHYKAGD